MGEMIQCVTCGETVAMAEADIVGQGYRCAPCGQKASIASLSGRGSDIADHLTPEERERNMQKFRVLAIGGAGITIVAVAMIVAGLFKSGFVLMLFGLAELVWGWRGYAHNRGP
jgi:hypothetical protein